MVERIVCSTGEESSATGGVKSSASRNDGFVLLGTGDAENKRRTRGYQVVLEPEVSRLESSRLDSSRGGASGGTSGRFSLFKWFKRGSRESTTSRRSGTNGTSSPEDAEDNFRFSGASSTESVDTFYSTATVRSFAFHSGTLRTGSERGPTSLDLLNHTQRKVGPFGAGAAKIVVKRESQRQQEALDVTRTLPANALNRRRDLTARYSLQPGGFGSCGNFGGSQRGLGGSLRRLDDRGTGRRVHVRGKRRAPNPPGPAVRLRTGSGAEDARTRGSGRRKKRRPAPKPPERNSGVLEVVEVAEDKKDGKVEPGEVGGSAGKVEEAQEKSASLVAPAESKLPPGTDVKVTLTKPEDVAAPSSDDEVKPDLRASIRVEDEESRESPQSISNDTLVLQGGVLHSKRESSKSTLTSSSSSATNAPGVLSDRESLVPLARVAITTGSQTSAMPRPWYKRSVFEHSRDASSTTKRSGDVLRTPAPLDPKDGGPGVPSSGSSSSSPKAQHAEKSHEGGGGTLSRLNFFHRSEKNTEERRKETKRKSGLSILANISELDKEAAAIVQEEQARTRAASMLLQATRVDDPEVRNDQANEEVVQDMVTSAMESSPRRGTRALISKFNAIGNITKVTVNSSFFSRGQRDEAGQPRNSRFSQGDWRERSKVTEGHREVRVEKDLSRYFLPQQSSPKTRSTGEVEGKATSAESPKNSRAAQVATRLSFLQGSTKTGLQAETSRAEDLKPGEKVVAPKERNESHENSPKLSRLQVRVINSETGGSRLSEVNDRRKGDRNEDGGAEKKVDLEDVATRKNVEVMQREFSSIFSEIDRQLASKEFQRPGDFGVKAARKPEAGTSSQVSRVLDILVEAEKGDRLRSSWAKPKEPELFPGNNSETPEKSRNSALKTDEDPATTDLKEMLKEMKHSLPKRPKLKKPAANREIPVEDEKRPEEVKPDVKVTEGRGKRDASYLMNSVTVVYPPPIRIGPPMEPAALKTNPVTFEGREVEGRDYERQKVSSAAQTCGNVRKVSRPTGPATRVESPKWRKEDVVYRTSGKGAPGTSGLVKNTFQLIRPREFAQIEAVKTMKSSGAENTYANVVERESLYANAPVTRKILPGLPTGPRREETRDTRRADEVRKVADKVHVAASESNDEAQEPKSAVDQQNMNTLAVNRLLRKLEAAIASGHHQQAAGLAKELARLKIHCSVVRQRTRAKDVVNVNLYIEDKLAHQGPIPLRLAPSMTVAQLKTKVFTEFEIPTNVQRWIVGKNLADDDATTLEELQAVEGSTVFLYLVAPELKVEEPSERVEQKEEILLKEPEPKPEKEIVTVAAVEKDDEEDEEEEEQTVPQIAKEDEEDEGISEEVRMERYEALISLENCDVIPNSEPIECPICFVTYGPQEGVILRDCLHMFCRPCIANTIRYCEEAEVKCPYRDTEYTCESTLQEREIKSLVETEVYQQHLAKSIAQAENNAGNNAFHCKTPDCPGWCIYDDNVNNFLCPVCGVNNCLTCQVVHTGKNCRQYQQELRFSKETDQESKRTAAMLEEMVDRGEALPCPTCAVVLMKKWGCDWLRCSMCKTEICWVTRGPRWGPGGKGDTSGGCRCGENGVKCHPRCNYCH